MKRLNDTSRLCWECTGAGLMIGNYPCKVCRGTGMLPKEKPTFGVGIGTGRTTVHRYAASGIYRIGYLPKSIRP